MYVMAARLPRINNWKDRSDLQQAAQRGGQQRPAMAGGQWPDDRRGGRPEGGQGGPQWGGRPGPDDLQNRLREVS